MYAILFQVVSTFYKRGLLNQYCTNTHTRSRAWNRILCSHNIIAREAKSRLIKWIQNVNWKNEYWKKLVKHFQTRNIKKNEKFEVHVINRKELYADFVCFWVLTYMFYFIFPNKPDYIEITISIRLDCYVIKEYTQSDFMQ